MSDSSKGMPAPTINVTPLIDVLLVLLIIFMVATPLSPHKLETKIPEKPQHEPLTDEVHTDALVLTIDREKKLTLNSQPLTDDQLAARIHEVIEQRPTTHRTLFIKAPRDMSYSYIVNIIDKVKGAGASPIGLQVDYLDEI